MKQIQTLFIYLALGLLKSFGQTPGTIDATFGSNGFIITPLTLKGEDGIYASQILRQTDGKYLACFAVNDYDDINGSYLQDFYIYRFDKDGKAEGNFGTGGRIQFDFDVAKFFIQSDKKLLVCGMKDGEIIIERYLPDGTLDKAYGFEGVQYTGLYFAVTASLLLQNGQLLIAGTHPTDNRTLLVKLTKDGFRDFTFGADGVRTYDYDRTNFSRYMTNIKEMNDGKILMGGVLYGTMQNLTFATIVRLNQQFNYDSTFSNDGVQLLNYQGFRLADFQLTGEGKIIVSGYYFYNNYQSTGIVLSRLKVNGTPDSTFGVKSTRTCNYGGARDFINNMLIQPDGKPIAAGNSDNKFGLLRLNTQGNYDAAFNGNGKSSVVVGNISNASIRYIEMEADGKLLIAGYTYNNDSTGSFVLARYHSGYNTGIIETTHNNNRLKVYPNPASNNCTVEYTLIKAEMVRISVYDITGKMVLSSVSEGIKAADSYTERLNTEQLNKGVYILVLEHGSDKSTHKLIKE